MEETQMASFQEILGSASEVDLTIHILGLESELHSYICSRQYWKELKLKI